MKAVVLLEFPATFTTMLPVVPPVGTCAVMLVLVHVITVMAVPLRVIVLVPCAVPKVVPVIITPI